MKIFTNKFDLLLAAVVLAFSGCVEPFQPVDSTLVLRASKKTVVQLTYYTNDGRGGIARESSNVEFTDMEYYCFISEVGKTHKILEKHPEYGFVDVQRISGDSPVYATPVWMVTINDKQERLLITTEYSVDDKFDALCSQTDLVTILNDDEVHSIPSVTDFQPPTIKP